MSCLTPQPSPGAEDTADPAPDGPVQGATGLCQADPGAGGHPRPLPWLPAQYAGHHPLRLHRRGRLRGVGSEEVGSGRGGVNLGPSELPPVPFSLADAQVLLAEVRQGHGGS